VLLGERRGRFDFNMKVVEARGIFRLSAVTRTRVPSLASLCFRKYCAA